jgi:hypothetical protein
MYVPSSAEAQPPVIRLRNHAWPTIFLELGAPFLLVWILIAVGVMEVTSENPFLGLANRASIGTTFLGSVWLALVVLFSNLWAWIRMPPEIEIGPDWVSGTPPRKWGHPPAPITVVIHFQYIVAIRTHTPMGPMVVSSDGGRFLEYTPESKMLHLTIRNARILKGRPNAWRAAQASTALT